MALADEILSSMNANRIMPCRAELKRMVNNNQWREIGNLFGFKPMFHFGATNWIDWRCVPESLQEILRGKPLPEKQFGIVKEVKPKFRFVNRKLIQTNNPHIRVPSKPRAKTSSTTRELLFKTQKGVCHYCCQTVLRANWSVDHKIPISRNGGNRLANKVGACKTCNGLKACLTEEEFLLFAEHSENGIRKFPDKNGIKRMVSEISKRIL